MSWLDNFTANLRFYTTAVNRFTGTLRDVQALRVEWSYELENILHEGRVRLMLGALVRARERGQIGERDYWEWRGKLS